MSKQSKKGSLKNGASVVLRNFKTKDYSKLTDILGEKSRNNLKSLGSTANVSGKMFKKSFKTITNEAKTIFVDDSSGGNRSFSKSSQGPSFSKQSRGLISAQNSSQPPIPRI